MFCKSGAEATSMALVVARAHRGRRKVLLAKGAYHGAHPWNTPRPAGTLPEDRAHLIYYAYGDLDSVAAAVGEAGDDLAGIFASPFRHDTFTDQTLPDAEFAAGLRRICDERDALLILDEVRAGFRLSRDLSWSAVGVAPDLSCWGKVLGNGQPLSALLGSDRARQAAEAIFVTGSFWFSAVPMAAALATLKLIRETDYLEHIRKIGRMFRQRLVQQAASFDFGLRHTGPETMPMVLFEDDPDFRLGNRFARQAIAGGAWISPYHNMFMNAAMTEADIERALAITGRAFEDLKRHPSAPG
jgi:glutamate-1-semialdehyde 2,1-aminomutase